MVGETIDLRLEVGQMLGRNVADKVFLHFPTGLAPAPYVQVVRAEAIFALRGILEPRGADAADLEAAYAAYCRAFCERYGVLVAALDLAPVGMA